MRLLLAALALALLAPAARADTCTWVKLTAGVWSAPDNWSCFTDGARVPGPADTALLRNGATVDLAGVSPTLDGLELSGVTVLETRAGTLTVTGSLNILGAPAVRGTGTLRLAAGGSGTISVVPLSIEGSARIVNEGTLAWSIGRIVVNAPDGLTNLGTFLVSADASPGGLSMSGSGGFVNGPGATLTRSGPGDTRFGLSFRNAGAVAVQQGELSLSQGAPQTDTGTYAVGPGTTLRLGTGNQRTLAPGASISGAGRVVLDFPAARLTVEGTLAIARVEMTDDALLVLNTATTLPTLAISAGTLSGSGAATVTGTVAWSGGTLGGSGTLSVATGATLTMSAGAMRLEATRTLAVDGSGVWTAGTVAGAATATFINRGALAVQADASSGGASWSGARTVNAAGATLSRSGPGVTRWAGPFDNAGRVSVGGGSLSLQSGGQQTGTFDVATGATLEFIDGHVLAPGAVVEGTGLVRQTRQVGQLTHGATLRPGGTAVGTLLWAEASSNAPAPFAPTADAVLDIALGGTAAGQSDRLAVTANAVLGGTLRVRLAPGYTPAVGDRFAVVTCSGTCSGAFAALDLPPGLTGDVQTSALQAEFVVSGGVASEDAPGVPEALALGVAPNPARGAAAVQVALPAAAVVRVSVVDLLGREVAVLAEGERAAGAHAFPLDTSHLAPGVYAVRLATPAGALVRRLTVAR